jgi:HNH endonuclease
MALGRNPAYTLWAWRFSKVGMPNEATMPPKDWAEKTWNPFNKGFLQEAFNRARVGIRIADLKLLRSAAGVGQDPVAWALENFEKGFRTHPSDPRKTGKQGLKWDLYLGSKKIEHARQSIDEYRAGQSRDEYGDKTIVRVDNIRRADGKPLEYPDPIASPTEGSTSRVTLGRNLGPEVLLREEITQPHQKGDLVQLIHRDPRASSNPPISAPETLVEADASSGADRKRVQAMVTARPGQGAFRTALLSAYDCSCAISGWQCEDVCEAAHIISVEDLGTDDISNGLLLRADLHILFDEHLISVNPADFRVVVAEAVSWPLYAELSGQKLRHLPKSTAQWPSKEALERHLAKFQHSAKAYRSFCA